MAQSYRFRVTGRVQGVRFRQAAAECAAQWGVAGWIRNCPDGAVEGAASGDTASLESFRRWLTQGPPTARVVRLEWVATPFETHEGFVVRR